LDEKRQILYNLSFLIHNNWGGSRTKDIFDLNLLLPKCNAINLKKSLTETFRYRGDHLPENIILNISQIDRTLLKMGWASAVSDIPKSLNFDKEFEGILAHLKAIYVSNAVTYKPKAHFPFSPVFH